MGMSERRFKFKISESPNCEYCGEIESVKHRIWDCDRSKSCWEYFNQLTEQFNESAYATYESVILGSNKPEQVLEEIIVLILRMIMAVDRSNFIEQDQIKKAIKNKYSLDKMVSDNHKKLQNLDVKWNILANFVT